jgi:hypothetical protein
VTILEIGLQRYHIRDWELRKTPIWRQKERSLWLLSFSTGNFYWERRQVVWFCLVHFGYFFWIAILDSYSG